MLSAVKAQLPTPVPVGETVPDLVFKNISNYTSASARLSDFKGKLVILDFWSTGCPSCIAAFPKMEKLQKTFGERIQIILVNTHETEAKIREREALTKRKIVFPDLPSVTGDSLLRYYFPYITVPHHVWIDATGKVLSITHGYNATVEHIQAALDGNALHMAVKVDPRNTDWENNGLVASFGGLSEKMQVYSAFMRHTPEIRGGIGLRKDSATAKVNRRYFINYPVLALYQYVFGLKYAGQKGPLGESIFRDKNRFVVEAKDTAVFQQPADRNLWDAWNEKYLFCYELKVASELADAMPALMEEDINRYFGALFKVNGSVEKRKTKCWVLTTLKDTSLMVSKGERGATIINDAMYKVINSSFVYFSRVLNGRLQDTGLPVVDETGIKGNVDMQLNCNLTDIPKLKKELARYGIIMKKEERALDILVLRDI